MSLHRRRQSVECTREIRDILKRGLAHRISERARLRRIVSEQHDAGIEIVAGHRRLAQPFGRELVGRHIVRSGQACLREIYGRPSIEEQGGLINLVDPEDSFEFDLDRPITDQSVI